MNETGAIRGEYGHRSTSFSLFTRHFEPYPNRKRLLIAVAALSAFALIRGRRTTRKNLGEERTTRGEKSQSKRNESRAADRNDARSMLRSASSSLKIG
jgi:hypothetical protein